MDDRDRKRAKKEKHAKERSSRPEKKVRTLRPAVCNGGWPSTSCCPCLSVCCVGYLINPLAPCSPARILAVCFLRMPVCVRTGTL